MLRAYILTLILSINNFFPLFANASEYKEDLKQSSEIELISENNVPEYILGAGDVLALVFYGLELFSGEYTINQDGYLILPEIEHIYAQDKTLSELRNLLYDKYKEFIIEPNLVVSVVTYRPVNVTLRGEVYQTGLYTLQGNNEPVTLFDVLQQGGGITTNANLEKIVVIRNNPAINGGGKLKTNINFIKLLDEGDQNQNIPIKDGDDILVSRSEESLIHQLNKVNKSNLTPSTINIFINGNVRRSGRLEITQGATLYEAIAASGDKPLSGTIELIRLKNSGRNEKRFLAYNKKSLKGSYGNPILINGDIITVRKNLLGKTTQAIKEYSTPVFRSAAIYKIFN